MNMEIEIPSMPFARRLRELRQGNVDLLLGCCVMMTNKMKWFTSSQVKKR